jgi:UrcA family protein
MKTFARTLAAASCLAAAFVAGPAAADDVAFRYNEHDLESAASVARLYARIEVKVKRACAAHSPGLVARAYEKACAADLLNDFVTAIDDPALTALFETRAGERYAAAP